MDLLKLIEAAKPYDLMVSYSNRRDTIRLILSDDSHNVSYLISMLEIEQTKVDNLVEFMVTDLKCRLENFTVKE